MGIAEVCGAADDWGASGVPARTGPGGSATRPGGSATSDRGGHGEDRAAGDVATAAGGGAPSRAAATASEAGGCRPVDRTLRPPVRIVPPPPSLSDDERRSAVRSRIEAEYARIARGLRILAFEILGDEHEAEDAAHDAFAVVLERAVTVRDPQALEAWLRRTARNLAMNRLRRRRRCRPEARASVETLDRDPEEGPRVVRRSGAAEPEPCAVVAVGEAFAALTADLREATTLFYVEGYSCAEVAQAQGVAEGCARTRVHRGRRRLFAGMFGSGEEA